MVKGGKKSDPASMLPLSPVIFAILLALADEEKHGYGIMKQAALPEGGGVSMGPGTLYGSLDRMARDGLIEEADRTDDKRRRYYRITRFGSKVLSAESLRLRHALRAVPIKGAILEERS